MIEITITVSEDALESDREVDEIFSQVASDIKHDYSNGELSIGATFVGEWELKFNA